MSGRLERRRRAGTRLWIPFAVYAAVTVLVPLLHGGDRHAGFWEHAAITLVVPALIVLAWSGLSGALCRRKQGPRPPPSP